MVVANLTPDLVKAGEDLLREMDVSKVGVNAALWFYFIEDEDWKLLLSFPDVKKEGPKAAYARVQKALSRLGRAQGPRLDLDDVVITKPDASILKLLKTAIHTGPGISNIRFSNNIINGQLIPDAHIYRLR